jgi:cell division septum initiation protein DivIVA
MSGEVRYTLDGRKVLLVKETDKGFLVQDLYTDPVDGEIVDDKIRFEEKIYDDPPKKAYESEVEVLKYKIEALNKEIAETQARKDEVAKEMIDAQALISERYKIITQHGQLKLLEDYVNGKISHYVVVHSATVDIVEFGDALYDDGWGKQSARLLTLAGDSKGDLQWRLSRYPSESYSSDLVYPCVSYEGAMLKAQEELDKIIKEQKSPSDSTLGCADKHSLIISDAYREAVLMDKRASLEKQVEREKKAISEVRGKLRSVNKKLKTLRGDDA